MALPLVKQRITVEEYYRRERTAQFKSDYYKGEIFAMAGGTVRHSEICTNVIGELRSRLKKGPCRPFESNLRLSIKITGLHCYPDATVFCESLEYDLEDSNKETVINPSVIFEVLSPSTEAYDRGTKASNYRQIKSLQAYIFISQESAHVEMYVRQPEGSWLFREFKGLEATISIDAIQLQLPLKEIYDRIDFSDGASVAV